MNMKKETFKVHCIGDLRRPKIMLVHGAGFYWETCFKGIVEELQDEYCILTPELEGHCENPTEYMNSVNETAQKIINTLKEQGISEVKVIYGISLGASIAMELCLLNQIQVSHLVLDSGQYEAMGEMTEQYANIMADLFLNILQGEHLILPVKENMGYSNNRDVEVLQSLIYPQMTYEGLYKAFFAAYSFSIVGRVERLKMKVYVILGGNETYAKQSLSLIESVCLQELEVLEFKDRGHAEVLAKEPELLAKVIRDIITENR